MRVSTAELRRLIEEATVDAYSESEQRVGFLTLISEKLELPFAACVLGVEVSVERTDMNAAEEIVAVCRRGQSIQRIPVLDLPLPRPRPDGTEWIEAYRHWARGG